MISSIEIKQFRGIEQGKLENLTPLTILVGRNGCGKSSVLDAMLIGASPRPGEALLQTLQRHQGVVLRGRWLFWQSKDNRWEATIDVHCDPQSSRNCILSGGGDVGSSKQAILSFRSIPDHAYFRLISDKDINEQPDAMVNPSAGDFNVKSAPVGSIGSTKINPLAGVSNIRLIEAHGNGYQTPLHELFSETRRSGRKEQVRGLTSELVPLAEDIEILTEADDPIVYLVFPNGAIPVALAGDGIHALVRTALELASLSDGVALIEEPEMHQHPGAMRQTARAIWAAVRRNVQVVLTTHSLEFIDLLLAEAKEGDIDRLSLFRLNLEKGRLLAVQTSGQDVAFCREDIEQDLR
jgi:hypothetical protein